ncbi:hypothetical protein HAX54_022385, partial [Datura stramonium]|nr:hypothetical protein [Datura stramonium]
RNANGTPIQSVVSSRPLFGSRIASAVRGSILMTHRPITDRLLAYSVFCCTSV